MSHETVCPQPGDHVLAGRNALGEWTSTEASREAVAIVGEAGQPTRYRCVLGHEWPFRVSPADTTEAG